MALLQGQLAEAQARQSMELSMRWARRMTGLSTTGSISLGSALVAGKHRVPKPATGMTALYVWGFGTTRVYRRECF